MKMNNRMKAVVKIVEGLIFIAIGLSMVGCEEAKEVENIAIQDTKPVVEEVENEYCDNCGNRLDYCECNEEPQVEDEVVFNCINCGEAHLESQSYYNEDGMSACCEECYNDYVNAQVENINPTIKYECLDCHRWLCEDEMLNSTRCQDCYNTRLEILNNTPVEDTIITPDDPRYNSTACIACGSYNTGLGEIEGFQFMCHDCGANF